MTLPLSSYPVPDCYIQPAVNMFLSQLAAKTKTNISLILYIQNNIFSLCSFIGNNFRNKQ